jgi:teichuronic acid biosynthesis glycosyltransferase TuaC
MKPSTTAALERSPPNATPVDAAMIRALTLTSLFPSSVQPAHGVFVRQRLQHLVATQDVEIRVIAPVPWYPSHAPGPAEYTRYQAVPDIETVGPFTVSHPRYVVLPKIGMSVAPTLMAASILPAVRKVVAAGPRFDLIDAHYFYPDGVAAAWIAGKLGLPLVITARGSDINLLPKYSIPRRQILWAAAKASAIITVSDALREKMIGMGVPPAKITTLRNGYDPALFHPADRAEARTELGVSGKTLLSVGNLIESKGHHIVIEALTRLPDFNLVIIGSGTMARELKASARRRAVGDRVRFEGTVQQAKLRLHYSACDALVLASSREGMPNVLIESLACGCPVIATKTGGNPEVIVSREAGILLDERSAAGVEDGIRRLFADLPDRRATLRYAERFLWGPTSAGQFEIFQGVKRGRPVT